MKIIRRKCFETNSSSTHSISVSNSDELNQTVTLDSDRNFTWLCEGEYGWEIDKYNDVLSKIDYMSLYVRDWAGDKTSKFKNILENVIKDQSGANNVNINFGDKIKSKYTDGYEYYNNGYIDHQSVECNNYHYLFGDKNKLRSFLFSANSSFRTDNDNH